MARSDATASGNSTRESHAGAPACAFILFIRPCTLSNCASISLSVALILLSAAAWSNAASCPSRSASSSAAVFLPAEPPPRS